MLQNPLIEQAKQGNVNAIASLMNRLLKSQAMIANVERDGDRLDILIESDLRSLDDKVRIPKRKVLVGMLKKWFITLEVKTVSSINISWQQTGFDEPAWTEEIVLVEPNEQDVSQNGRIIETQKQPKMLPLPVFPLQSMHEPSYKKPTTSSPELDEMFGEINTPVSLPNIQQISNVENPQVSQGSEFLFLPDITSIPSSEEISDFQTETDSSSNAPSWQILLKTPSFAIQFVQYCVVCAIVILALRGIHTVFGGSKAPKAAAISTHLILQ